MSSKAYTWIFCLQILMHNFHESLYIITLWEIVVRCCESYYKQTKNIPQMLCCCCFTVYRLCQKVHKVGFMWGVCRVISGSWRSVRLLDRESDYIFRFIPIATFWYNHCFGAKTVPLWSKASKITKFPSSAPYDGAWNRVICRTMTLSAFISPRKRLHF